MLRQCFRSNGSSTSSSHTRAHDLHLDILAVPSKVGFGSRAVMLQREKRCAHQSQCVRCGSSSPSILHFSGGKWSQCGVSAPGGESLATGENRLPHGRQSTLALLHPSPLPIPSAFDGPVPARMNAIPSPLRRILDGYKKEEQGEEVGEEGNQEEDSEEGDQESREKEAHAERRVHEAHAAG